MKNQNYITNPKTKRKYEGSIALYKTYTDFAEANGYKVFSKFTNSWTFSKDGIDSVLGFDSRGEVLEFIFSNTPDPKKIFPPYGINP
jgi:hypothetical protein